MNVFERLFKLWSMICKMIMDGARDAEEVAEVLQRIVDGPKVAVARAVQEMRKTYLRRLFTFTLRAIDGKDTYTSARKVFRGYFDPAFENRGIVFSGVAPETEVAADELVRSGKFSDLLGNIALELEKRRVLGSQFLAICQDGSNKLRGEGGYANFFVLTKGDEVVAEDLSNVFVARVYVFDGDELNVLLDEFRFDGVWIGDNRLRVFSPQQ